MDKKTAKKRLIAKWDKELEVWRAYQQALQIIKYEVLPKWDGKPCNRKFEVALNEAVGHLCNAKILHHLKDLKQVSLRSLVSSYTTDDGWDVQIRNTAYNFSVKFDKAYKTPRISAAATIEEINTFDEKLILSEITVLNNHKANIDDYFKANEKLMKAVVEYQSVCVARDMCLGITVDTPMLLW